MHLFAGHGGGLLADLILGHRPIAAVEWDAYACQVLRERAADGWFPGLRVHEGDVSLFDPSEYTGSVDVINAGFPCQDISVAGKQAGVSEGTRSGLYREVLRIAGVVRPKFLFLENVSAILSNGLGTVLGDLAALGYDSRWCCIRASDVGAPHGRDRWWLRAEQSGLLSHAEHYGNGRGQQQQKSVEKEAGKLAYTERQRQQGQGQCFNASDCAADSQGQASHVIDDGEPRKRATQSELGGLADGLAAGVVPDQALQGWWQEEPQIGRTTDMSTNRAAMLKGLGNGQVPLQAATAWRLIGG